MKYISFSFVDSSQFLNTSSLLMLIVFEWDIVHSAPNPSFGLVLFESADVFVCPSGGGERM